MDFLTSNSQLLLEKSMGFLWTKQAAILDNIANAETPNYKAKVVTFEDSLRAQLEQQLSAGRVVMSGDGSPAAQSLSRATQSSIRGTIQDAEPVVFEAKVVTFEESIRAQLEEAASRPTGSGKAVRDILDDAELTVFEAQEQTRMDDNGVNTTSEMTELIRNAYQQQYVYQAINKHYSILSMAVRGQ